MCIEYIIKVCKFNVDKFVKFFSFEWDKRVRQVLDIFPVSALVFLKIVGGEWLLWNTHFHSNH